MGCIYECTSLGDDCGKCTMWDKGDDIDGFGVDSEGICVVSDDPDPENSCQFYESDYTCHECGADLNIEECACDDE